MSENENNENEPRGSMLPPEIAKQAAAPTCLYAFTLRDADGIERIVAVMTPRGLMPMVGLEGEQVLMERAAQEMCTRTGAKIQMWKYQDRVLVKTIEPQLVRPATGIRDGFGVRDALKTDIKK